MMSLTKKQIAITEGKLNLSGLSELCADFSGVNLTGANFTGADLTGADFRGAIFTGEGKFRDPILGFENFC